MGEPSFINKAKALFSSVVPDTAGVRATNQNIKEYMDATAKEPPKPVAPPPTQSNAVKSKARYGDRPGEKRIDVSEMTKPLASYKHGTNYVPKTGPAILHEGEKVVPKEQNPYAMVKEMAKDKKPKKELREMSVTKSHDGKYIIKHKHHSGAHEDETHVANDMSELHGHMDKHAGVPKDGEAGENPFAQLTASASDPE